MKSPNTLILLFVLQGVREKSSFQLYFPESICLGDIFIRHYCKCLIHSLQQWSVAGLWCSPRVRNVGNTNIWQILFPALRTIFMTFICHFMTYLLPKIINKMTVIILFLNSSNLFDVDNTLRPITMKQIKNTTLS